VKSANLKLLIFWFAVLKSRKACRKSDLNFARPERR